MARNVGIKIDEILTTPQNRVREQYLQASKTNPPRGLGRSVPMQNCRCPQGQGTKQRSGRLSKQIPASVSPAAELTRAIMLTSGAPPYDLAASLLLRAAPARQLF